MLLLPPISSGLSARDSLLRLIDLDPDSRISASEMAHAPDVLRSLDRNHDGKVTLNECLVAGDANQTRQRPSEIPIFEVLDTNRDGELSPNEIANATAALNALDRNADGWLTRPEVDEGTRHRN
jgi:Ca2+-binding EF-hand superfamily protein